MNHAQEVKKQIETLYSCGGVNHQDLAQHLSNNRIDNSVLANHSICGHDVSFDKSLSVMHFHDGSMIVIPCCGGISASS